MNTIIAGGALASLVAADALASQGRPVTLLTSGSHVGGRHAGIRADGLAFDLGLTAFEFGHDDLCAAHDPRTYDPDVRNDWGRFAGIVRQWVEDELQLPLVRMPAMELWYDGTVVPDFVCDTNIHGLSMLPGALRERIFADVVSLPADRESLMHARNKHADGLWDTLDLEVASLANHGRTLHDRFLAPFLRKMIGPNGAPRSLARYSRSIGMPLYWPETVRRGIAGDRSAMPATPFHVVAGLSMGQMVAQLRERLERSPQVSWRTGTITNVAPTAMGVAVTQGDTVYEGRELLWGGGLANFHRAAGLRPPEKLDRERRDVACVTIDARACRRPDTGTLIVPAGVALPYCVTNQSRNGGEDTSRMRLTLEYAWGGVPVAPDQALRKVAESLMTLGFISDPSVVRLHAVARVEEGLTVPSFSNQSRTLGARTHALNAGIPMRLIGPAAGFSVATIGDQVVQGLQAAVMAQEMVAVAA
ncbi:MAG: NAD(P)-binding protein [Gemmatimonadetes bacterium]|nr:NAD(P)-binding protein [Gemmatimonadota bacterium]